MTKHLVVVFVFIPKKSATFLFIQEIPGLFVFVALVVFLNITEASVFSIENNIDLQKKIQLQLIPVILDLQNHCNFYCIAKIGNFVNYISLPWCHLASSCIEVFFAQSMHIKLDLPPATQLSIFFGNLHEGPELRTNY